MANINQLTPRLWTGGDLPDNSARVEKDLLDWETIGVTHVIDNRIEYSDEQLVTEALPSIAYLHNGVDDAGQALPDAWFDRGVDFALDAWAKDPDAIVIAHCHMGINRGPTMAYAILLAIGWDPTEAIDLIRSRRPIAAVGYSFDALEWHHRRLGVSQAQRVSDAARLQHWHSTHPHDTIRIIRAVRAEEEVA